MSKGKHMKPSSRYYPYDFYIGTSNRKRRKRKKRKKQLKYSIFLLPLCAILICFIFEHITSSTSTTINSSTSIAEGNTPSSTEAEIVETEIETSAQPDTSSENKTEDSTSIFNIAESDSSSLLGNLMNVTLARVNSCSRTYRRFRNKKLH